MQVQRRKTKKNISTANRTDTQCYNWAYPLSTYTFPRGLETNVEVVYIVDVVYTDSIHTEIVEHGSSNKRLHLYFNIVYIICPQSFIEPKLISQHVATINVFAIFFSIYYAYLYLCESSIQPNGGLVGQF